MTRANQYDGDPVRSGHSATPRIRVAATLKDIKRRLSSVPGVFDITIVSMRCGRCGQGLVELLRIPRHILFPLDDDILTKMWFRPPPVANPNDLYIEQDEVYGWKWDGTTLRPTSYHLERQQRAQRDVWAKPRTKTERTRKRLAHHSRHSSGSYFTRRLGKQGDPWRHGGAGTKVELAPEWIECPRCEAEVHIGPTL
jgi:hypothetical protein